MRKWLGVCGLAQSGKDKFFELLSQRISCVRFALADELKKEIHDFILDKYHIDIFTCSNEEKTIVRPSLVSHGKIMRSLTNGRHWFDLLDKIIYDKKEEIGDKLVVITDIRYAQYEFDEVHWLKHNDGILVHLKKFVFSEIDGIKAYDIPPNEEEKINDPKLEIMADYRIEWPNYTVLGKDDSILYPYVNEFVFKLQDGFFNK